MRAPRKASGSDLYHVVARGVGRQLIFETDDDRLDFLALLDAALSDEGAEIYAWCLMGNHVHLLIRAPLKALSRCMQKTLGRYSQRFNLRYGRTGHLFQERFKSETVEDDSYLLTVLRYIHENPEKAGLARTAEYRWSSYREYVGKAERCSTELVLGMLGGADGFEAFHHEAHAQATCLDCSGERSRTRPLPEDIAIARAKEVCGKTQLADVKALDRAQRDALLRAMRGAGLSIRQIERLTGIGRNIVATA